MNARRVIPPLLASVFLLGCSGGPSGLTIVSSSGALQGVAGDALALKITDGSSPLPAGATVTWSGAPTVTALDPSSTAASPLPAFGDAPTAVFIANPGRTDVTDLGDVLFILDPGTQPSASLSLTATVTGATTGSVTVTIPVGAAPKGDAARGATIYGDKGAQCSACHGTTGHGTDADGDGMYKYDGNTFPYPAPGLNAEDGNLASDPGWNAALLAMAARADMDNGGLTLRAPMPSWLGIPNPATNQPLSAQDYADVYAFLQTQKK